MATTSHRAVAFDEFFDFNTLPTAQPKNIVKPPLSSPNLHLTSSASPYELHLSPSDIKEDSQTPSKPQFPYDDHKQTTGLPPNSIPGLNPQVPLLDGSFSSAGLDDQQGLIAWPNDYNMEPTSMEAMFASTPNPMMQNTFIDPASISQPPERMRAYPGMHSQAAQAQAQAQAQARQLQQQQQQQQMRQVVGQSQSPEGQLKQVIAKVVHDMRTRDAEDMVTIQAAQDHPTPVPHIGRMRKEEAEMDADEKLLASEEGKGLSSKERRQLRNKVSARAFRHRRKEYIQTLENDGAAKQQRINDLVAENNMVKLENISYRRILSKVISDPAFASIVPEIAQELSMMQRPQTQPSTTSPMGFSHPAHVSPQPMAQQNVTPVSQGYSNFPATSTVSSDLQMDGMSQMTTMSSTFPDSWPMPDSQGDQYLAYAVVEIPAGPSDPLDADSLSGKGFSSFFAPEASVGDVKTTYPIIESLPTAPEMVGADEDGAETRQDKESSQAAADDEDAEFDLYYTSAPTSASTAASFPSFASNVELDGLGNVEPEKVSAHFQLVVTNSREVEEQRANQELSQRFEQLLAICEPVMQRMAALTAHLDI